MLKKFLSVRTFLTLGLIASIIFAAFSIYYKTKYWGFSFNPKQTANVWTIEAHINFMPMDNEPIKVSIATPTISSDFKILDENIIAKGYKIKKEPKNNRIILSSQSKQEEQNLYYQLLLLDNT